MRHCTWGREAGKPCFDVRWSSCTFMHASASHAGVPRNLAVRFTEDQIDDTSLLTRTLSQGAALGASLDLTQLDLPGDHLRPLK